MLEKNNINYLNLINLKHLNNKIEIVNEKIKQIKKINIIFNFFFCFSLYFYFLILNTSNINESPEKNITIFFLIITSFLINLVTFLILYKPLNWIINFFSLNKYLKYQTKLKNEYSLIYNTLEELNLLFKNNLTISKKELKKESFYFKNLL